MNIVKKIVVTFTFGLISFGAAAQNVTACASTIDEAEALVAAKAKQAGLLTKLLNPILIMACI